MCHQLQAQHLGGNLARLINRLGYLHPAAFATASGVNLGFDYNSAHPGAEQVLRRRFRLFACFGRFARRHCNTILLQDFFSLVFMNFHNDS